MNEAPGEEQRHATAMGMVRGSARLLRKTVRPEDVNPDAALAALAKQRDVYTEHIQNDEGTGTGRTHDHG
jgi:hypothetical protein